MDVSIEMTQEQSNSWIFVLFKVTVAAVALPSRSDDLVDLTAKVATVSGYGYTSNGGSVSNCLMYTTLPVISNAVVSIMSLL